MRRSLESPSRRQALATDLVLTTAGVALGLLTLALQRAADDGTWRDIDALAVAARAADGAARRDMPARADRVGASRRSRPRWSPPRSATRRHQDGSQRCSSRPPPSISLTAGTRSPSATFALVGDVLASIAGRRRDGGAAQRVSARRERLRDRGPAAARRHAPRAAAPARARCASRAARLAQLRGAEAGEAAARERVRIAREVHDVVGNDLSAIAVQAGAGRTLVDANPDEVRATFERIARDGPRRPGPDPRRRARHAR